ncbi:MAG TPA: 4a-hydroxytetrahydrobiopterin dehydratase [Candidatus Nanopelagicales bacterium]|jgi:4a-hydroxytetrahydrobiopterin dehydratase|nr:4a-hydroxytetrahydrobiopterin dehydratase [Candidatus Nanopelagicales bacterium]
MSEVLDDDDRDRQLAGLPGWHGERASLQRSYEFPAFLVAVLAVDDVATAAEAMDHHPDIDIRWRTVTFTLSTHSAGGVTSLDIELAHRIHELAGGHGGS